ncbi:hypothetical protein JCM30760_10700 [Thiomicrorhabdus hydrogeniphila]
MATVATLMPKMGADRDYVQTYAQTQSAVSSRHNQKAEHSVCQFRDNEVDMMPGQWAEAGNPTPYELRVTIQTCKRLWYLNKEALDYVECDQEATLYNIKVLEKLYIHLMDYLSG